ncbi:(d)CMP kinase [Aestuariibius insulae]|uniref:(d)CMP kinase n=1 Tax=Aestuariibius insulae TaxID=2058287 RepID=UPI00345E61EC
MGRQTTFTVAIDGPAAAGKGTISKRIAERFDLAHLDTGLLYRAVGALSLAGQDPIEAARTLVPSALDREDLRTPQVAKEASQVAAMPEVRGHLLAFQRDFARQEGGAVLDGRDIGTVICPDANVKLFVTANAEVRAKRRHAELTGKGLKIDYERVLSDVIARDQLDEGRQDAPMFKAEDAILIDTSEMDIETAVAKAVEIVAAHLD